MPLDEDLRRIADAAVRFAAPGEELAGIVPAEPSPGSRAYLCGFRDGNGGTSWLVLDADGHAVGRRADVREVVSIAALCELAEEVAAGGDLDELRSELVALRLTDNPPGLAEAEDAALALQTTLGGTPRVATPAHLDAIGAATLKLEQALGGAGGSPFATAMQQATGTVEELLTDVEGSYKVPLT